MNDELTLQGLPSHLTTEEREVLRAVKKALVQVLGGRGFRILLFGSKARGDFDSNSDLDLAVIVDDLSRQTKRAVFDAVADVEIEHLMSVSALVLSSEEFRVLRERERRIALDISTEGIPL